MLARIDACILGGDMEYRNSATVFLKRALAVLREKRNEQKGSALNVVHIDSWRSRRKRA